MSGYKDLESLITPSLLTLIAEAQVPWSKTERLDFAEVAANMPNKRFREACKASTARDALLALSKLSPDATIPPSLDLMSFLPPPGSPDFPQQCYGLQCMLDQASRVLFDGIGGRWQSAYFGPLARQLAGQWYALPEALRPDKWERWRDEAGVSFDYWIVMQTLWSAPFLHAEDLDSQRIGVILAEETRKTIQTYSGERDPYHKEREAILGNDKIFLQEVFKGPIDQFGPRITLSEWAYWWCMIKDAHWPIIRRFGRYPYRNAILGRDSTEEEKEWLEATGHVAEAPPDIAARIREDIEKGSWTLLGEE